eukprot:1935990-Lingulodinium_polyedra.AAC.2
MDEFEAKEEVSPSYVDRGRQERHFWTRFGSPMEGFRSQESVSRTWCFRPVEDVASLCVSTPPCCILKVCIVIALSTKVSIFM